MLKKLAILLALGLGFFSGAAAAQDNDALLLGYLRVTELMYEPAAGNAFEYIELRNTSATATLDLEGVTFLDGIDYSFPAGVTLEPLAYQLLAKATDLAAFRSQYGLPPTTPVAGGYVGRFSNGGERVEIRTSPTGPVIVDFDYNNGRGWPQAAAGPGHSLVVRDDALAGQTSNLLSYGRNWRASTYLGGSPGAADPEPIRDVVVNEFMAHTDLNDPNFPAYDSNDWIELHNTTESDILLDGWYLSDDPFDLTSWAIPAVTIPAGGFISFDETTGFHNPITTGFGLNKAGEQIFLSYLPAQGPRRVADSLTFKGQSSATSLGRWPDGTEFFQAMPSSRDFENLAPLETVHISEFMYHPPADADIIDSATNLEYVELTNPTASAVDLWGLEGSWRLDGGADFLFPIGTQIPAGATLVVVGFDPADATALSAFEEGYNIDSQDVSIIGPWDGRLSNRGESIALERPQAPDGPGEPFSWIIVDEVIYFDDFPWTEDSDGSGLSLHRLSRTNPGNDPASWRAAPPSIAPAVESRTPALKVY